MGKTRRNAKRGNGTGDARKSATPPGSPSSPTATNWRRFLFLALLFVLAGVAAALLIEWNVQRQRKPVLTTLKIEGLDPIVAALIEEGQEEVRKDPQSATAWGK